MRRRFGRRGTGGGRGFGGILGLVVSAVGLGALIFFLLRRTRGEDVRESVERVSETVRSGAAEYVGTSSREAEPPEAEESPAGQEGATAEGDAEARRRTVRQFADRLEEQRPAGQEEGQEEEVEASEGTREDTREELRSIVRESVRRSEGSSRSSEEGGSGETAQEEGRTDERSGAGEQVTVVGVLAKMGEAFEETGGGQFILSSETEGNFDLHGKEDELDEIYQQQVQAEVVGRVTDEDAQPKVMEVDEVRSA
ncbi:MAG: hypothetical protein M3P92_09480 [Actinomycetota bacterium]|nr:hypothetical protein [Actinomycetota bacterium]